MKNSHRITGISLFVMFVIISGCGQKGTETTTGQSFGSIHTSMEVVVTPSSTPTPSLTPSVPSNASSPTTPVPTQQSESSPQVFSTTSPQVQPASNKPLSVTPTQTPPEPTKTVEPVPTPKVKPSVLSNEITWSEFFDNDKQDTPSNKFWDMNGKTVQIKGFMGEVLSFDKHWFLLIPQPGAECPFDNGDETYWNKIMIVYVPDTVKLRYTSGPLVISGKLDVGIKLDESGYKTMFRLYDASFEKMKE